MDVGWTTCSEPHAARLTIGIGAGNPGGATFHAVMFEHDGSHACSLTGERHWLLGTNRIRTVEVVERREPILLAGNDADDGLWQLIGRTGVREPWVRRLGYPS